MELDELFIKKTIELAKLGRGHTRSNPLVGCVIVKDGKIISQGYHEKFGENHAERNAILNSKVSLEGSDLYVNLEPCSHFGKTPPCTDLIIKSKIKRVVVGCLDSNEKVAGKGIQKLRDNGIEVRLGVLEDQCRDLNKKFFYFIKNKRPYVVLKTATSLDGKIATFTGNSKWISSEASRRFAHSLRNDLDGILVGINTIIKDDPSLNVRDILNPSQPNRIIVDSKLRIPLDSKLLKKDIGSKTYIYTSKNYDREVYKKLCKVENLEIVVTNSDKQVDLREMLKDLGSKNISSILLEGGGNLNFSMLSEGLVNYGYFFLAPKIIGGRDALTSVEGQGFKNLEDSISLKNIKIDRFDEDLCIRGEICLPE